MKDGETETWDSDERPFHLGLGVIQGERGRGGER